MTAPLSDLARAYDALHPRAADSWPFPPTPLSIRRINEALSLELPESLLWFTANTSACHHWLASLGEDFDSWNHILHMASRTRRIRRRVVGGHGRWEYVKPETFVPFNHGYDQDYDCLDTGTRNLSTGEYAIQHWSPPRVLGEHRFGSFPEYIEWHIKGWAAHSRAPVKEAVFAIVGTN